MVQLVGALLALVLAAIAAIHLYWAAGGRRGIDAVLPQLPDAASARVFTPSPLATIAVAAALLVATALVAMRAGIAPSAGIPPRWLTLGTGGVAAVLALRGIGDFRYVGLFKRVKGTRFARADSTLFTPLCLALAAGCAFVALS